MPFAAVNSMSGSQSEANSMRETFLPQAGRVYILPFFEALFGQDLRDIEICSIFASRAMGSRKRAKLVCELIRLYGAPGFARLAGMQMWQQSASALRLSRLSGSCHSL